MHPLKSKRKVLTDRKQCIKPMKFCQPISYLNTKKDYQHLNQYLNVQLMCFNWYTSLHNLNAYQIKFFNQLEKRKTCVYTLCMHLVQVIILQGIILFQSLKFYYDEIPCKKANLLVTDLLVLSVTVQSMHVSITSLGLFCLTLNSSLIWSKCHIFVVVVVQSWKQFGLFCPFDNK